METGRSAGGECFREFCPDGLETDAGTEASPSLPAPPGDTVLSSVPHRTKGRGHTKPRLPGFITAYGWSPETICSAVTGPFPGSPRVHGRLRTLCSPAEPLGARPKPAGDQVTAGDQRERGGALHLLTFCPKNQDAGNAACGGWVSHCLTMGHCDFRLTVMTAYALSI